MPSEIEKARQAAEEDPANVRLLEIYARRYEAAGKDYGGRATVDEWFADFYGQESGWPIGTIVGFGRKAVPALARGVKSPASRYGALMCLRLL